jgi:hypothetical protein
VRYNPLARLTFFAGFDTVIVDFGPAALSACVYVEAAALIIGTGFVSATILSGDNITLGP